MNDERKKEKARAAIYSMTGVYLLYTAYQIFTSRMDSVGNEYVLMLIFSVLFLIFGIGLIVFSIYMMKKNEKK